MNMNLNLRWLSSIARVPDYVYIVGTFILVALVVYSVESGITFWDWLKALLVPAAIGVVAPLFARAQNRNAQVIADQRAQDDALQAYIDQMGELLLKNGLGASQVDAGARANAHTVARARTLTVLRRLGPKRKRSVLDFLYESELITTRGAVVDLGGPDVFGGAADLSSANLIGDHLARADLTGTILNGADLRGANLKQAGLGKASLRSANLGGADLSGANLNDADLTSASLAGAILKSASIRGANLSSTSFGRTEVTKEEAARPELEAEGLSEDQIRQAIKEQAILQLADLRGAKGLTQEQLEQALGDPTTRLPDYLQRPETWSTDLSDRELPGGVKDHSLGGADLSYTDLAGVTLIDRYLADADLRYANLAGADLSGANLTSAVFDSANLENAVLNSAILQLADLRGAKGLTQEQLEQALGDPTTRLPDHLQRPEKWGSDLRNATMLQADLGGMDLSDVNLSHANLYGANLKDATLNRVVLKGANLTKVDLRAAQMKGTILSWANLLEADLRETTLSNATILCGADLRGADLSEATVLTAEGFRLNQSESEDSIQEQIDNARGDDRTQLPAYLQRPKEWSDSYEAQRKRLESKDFTQLRAVRALVEDLHMDARTLVDRT